MLKSWSIQNFKPIVDSGDLKLAPVTVLAGRNSSGKSSLIQSILMIAQTLSSRILDRPLLPNGPMIQLGTFEDILSEQTGLRTLMVGFELEMEMTEAEPFAEKLDSFSVLQLSSNIRSVKTMVQFRSASSNGTNVSAIEASKVNIENVSLEVIAFLPVLDIDDFFPFDEGPPIDEEPPIDERPPVDEGPPIDEEPSMLPDETIETPLEFNINIKRLTPGELNEFLKNVLSDSLKVVPSSQKDSNFLGRFELKNSPSHLHIPDPSLVAFSHFLPARFIRKYSVEERRKTTLIEAVDVALGDLVGGVIMPSSPEWSALFDSEAIITDSLREAIGELCKDENIQVPFSGQTLRDLMRWYSQLRLQRRRRVKGEKPRGMGNISSRLKDTVVQSILSQEDARNDKGTEALEAITNNTCVDNLEEAVKQINRFFTSKIRYLGPLRADPQASQRFAPSSELDDVGQKGEYAAAVYDANQNAQIRWYNPFKNKVQQGTLRVALDTWISYLGVANKVKIQEAGQSGVSWQVVHMEGHKALPLAAVGVGVSQILPVLVMGLLAPSNTLLLVEQPELHLHPGVQARLGDFFMGLAKCDKQCLIETHSENLVSQLRYHIVQAGGQEQSDCLIYFVDQDQRGAAQFNPIEISPQGNILNWPDGFFDETMLQEDKITAASIKKRAEKTRNG